MSSGHLALLDDFGEGIAHSNAGPAMALDFDAQFMPARDEGIALGPCLERSENGVCRIAFHALDVGRKGHVALFFALSARSAEDVDLKKRFHKLVAGSRSTGPLDNLEDTLERFRIRVVRSVEKLHLLGVGLFGQPDAAEEIMTFPDQAQIQLVPVQERV